MQTASSLFQYGSVIQKSSYFVLKQALSLDYCYLFSDYALAQAQARPNIKTNLDPLDHVHRQYGDPLFELLLAKLTPLIEQILGRAVWPSLSFYYVYTHGNALQKHRDRASCEWVASICLGADPQFKETDRTWPLCLNIADKTEEVNLECGDILLFNGHITEHWRTAFSGQHFVSAIFAFVEQEGPHAHLKYDQRAALGHPHIGMFRWTWRHWKQQWMQRF